MSARDGLLWYSFRTLQPFCLAVRRIFNFQTTKSNRFVRFFVKESVPSPLLSRLINFPLFWMGGGGGPKKTGKNNNGSAVFEFNFLNNSSKDLTNFLVGAHGNYWWGGAYTQCPNAESIVYRQIDGWCGLLFVLLCLSWSSDFSNKWTRIVYRPNTRSCLHFSANAL